MKKTFCLLLSVLFVIGLASCAASQEKTSKFEVMEVGGYDDNSVANHHSDVKLEVESYQKSAKMKESSTVTIEGKAVSGEYTTSKKGYLFNSEVNCYESSNDGTMVRFGVNEKTGVVDNYSYTNLKYSAQHTQSAELTKEQCEEIALQYLRQYADADKYSLVRADYLEIPEYKAIYNFEYAHLVNGIKTSDSAFLGVTVYGDVISHDFSTLNEFEKFHAPSEADNRAITADIEAKIGSIYDSINDKYTYSWSEEGKRFVKLSDGTYALECSVSVTLTPKDTSAKSVAEAVTLLVYLR